MGASFASYDRRCTVCYNPGCDGFYDPEQCPVTKGLTTSERTSSVRSGTTGKLWSESLSDHPEYEEALANQPGDDSTLGENSSPDGLGPHEVPKWDKPQDWEGWLAGEAALQVVAAGGAQ